MDDSVRGPDGSDSSEVLGGVVPKCACGDRAADDGAMVRRWALEGRGIAYKSRLDVQGDLDAGRLVDIFPDATYDASPLYVAYPSRR